MELTIIFTLYLWLLYQYIPTKVFVLSSQTLDEVCVRKSKRASRLKFYHLWSYESNLGAIFRTHTSFDIGLKKKKHSRSFFIVILLMYFFNYESDTMLNTLLLGVHAVINKGGLFIFTTKIILLCLSLCFGDSSQSQKTK